MKLKFLLAAAGLALAACGGQPTIAAVTEIPMELDANGHMRVPVAVGDEGTYDFILDTAASRTSVMDNLVQELGWQPLEGEAAVVNGSSGQASIRLYEPVPLGIGEDVAFTPDLLPALNPLSIPGDPFYGILGSNFFEAYAVEFDTASARLGFTSDGAAALLAGDTEKFAEVPIRPVLQGLWAMDVDIEGVTVTALIDTGARNSMMNRAAAGALGIDLPETAVAQPISGASGHQMSGIALQLDVIAVGAREWHGQQVLVSDLHVFDVLGLQDQPAMIFASDMLFDGRLIIDYANNRAFVEVQD